MVWVPGGRSGRQLVAALTATGGKDGATGAGSHPQAEAVRLGPATVVGLKGALAHGYLSTVDNCWGGARSFQSAGPRPAAPANYRSDSFRLSVGLSLGVAVSQRPDPSRSTRDLRHGSWTARNGRTEPTRFRVRTVRRDGQTRGLRSAAADYPGIYATRRRRCLRVAWSCGKCRKVVSVRLERLGITESPGATIPRRRGFSAVRAVAVPTSPHLWITSVDGRRGPIGARGNTE